MAEIRVNVSANKTQKVEITPGQVQNQITATPDSSQYYSNLAKSWAIDENLVQGTDYSSKYYAGKSSESATIAESYANAAEDTFDNVQVATETSLANIETARVEAVDNITTVKNEGIASVEAKGNEASALVDTGIANINTAKTEAVNAVTSTKTAILQDIEFVADGKKQEIQDLADEIKDNGDTVNIAIDSGVERLNSIDALKKSQITNCLLEVPQNIKLELNNGTLTLKAGSKVIVPNGFEADGTTPKFDYVTVESDVVRTSAITTTGTSMAYYTRGGQLVVLAVTGNGVKNNYFSGATAPTSTTYMTWYDTANNIVKATSSGGSTWSTGQSLPLGIVSYSADSAGFTSIDQVFNGMGYIGSTVFVDKGVKGLIPNGRNEDGSLRNIEYTTNKVLTRTATTVMNSNYNFGVELSNNDDTVPKDVIVMDRQKVIYNQNTKPLVTAAKWFDTDDNQWFYFDENNSNAVLTTPYKLKDMFFATGQIVNGVITSFQPKQPFRAVDYNDFKNLTDNTIGKPQISLDSSLPSDCIWLEGSTVSRTTYRKLFEIYGTTYGAGDGSTTFTLPDFRNRAIWGSNGFGYLSAGLPNITGWFTGNGLTNGSSVLAGGAFYVDSTHTSGHANYGGSGNSGFALNASRSSSIYGSSTTVQPPAIKVRVYARYK